MDSDSQKSPRSKFRFGFSGKRRRASDTGVTTDDILDSLTRQAASREDFASNGKIDSEEIAEDAGRLWDPVTEPSAPIPTRKERDLGRFGFALMLFGGLSVLSLYGFLTKAYDPSLLNRLLQYSGAKTAFAQPLQIVVIAASALLTALWIARKRRSSKLSLHAS